MSKYECQSTTLSEGPFLIAALKEMGFNPTVSESPAHLFGFQGDQRPEVAHIIIPRVQVGGAANDIGFIRENGVYKAIISQYDGRAGAYDKSWLGRLNQSYTINRKIAVAKALGYRVVSRSEANGKQFVKLEAMR